MNVVFHLKKQNSIKLPLRQGAEMAFFFLALMLYWSLHRIWSEHRVFSEQL